MFIVMYRPSNFSVASANLQRSSTGALKATRPAYNNRSSGKIVETSKPCGYGTSKPVNSMSSRALPNGPGPSPNRSTVERLKYVSSSSMQRTSLDNHVYRHKANTVETPRTLRKSSNDSGYGSSLNVNSRDFRCGTLSERKSKSFTQLYEKDETDTHSLYYRTRADPFSNSISQRTSLQSHNVNRNNDGNTRTLLSTSTTQRSTTHSDYKNPKGVDKQEVKGSLKTLERDLANECTFPGKNTHSVIDTNKPRKEIISALPNDLKMTKKSSYSSSNCSSATNSLYTLEKTGKVAFSIGVCLCLYRILFARKYRYICIDIPCKIGGGTVFMLRSYQFRKVPTCRRNSDGLIGLRNLGNTCFMNSILQCLSHTWPLTDQLLKSSCMQDINIRSSMKGKLIQAFADLMKLMWKPGSFDNAVSPHSFKTQIQRFAPRFVGYSQQDAQEFLRFLLEGLHDDLNQVKDKQKYISSEYDESLSDQQRAEKSWMRYLSRDKSLMTDLFVGQLKSMLKCCSCGYTSATFDPFWDLSLPIPRKSSLSLSTSSPWAGRRSSVFDDSDVNIIDCIQSFTKEEVLDGDERPTCDKCKVKTKSTKKFSIQRFPSILVLHLKRFSGLSFRSKLQTNVEFPLAKLDLGEFAADPQECMSAVYSLYAVSNHSGTTYGGHYTAYCKHPISKEWHCFNDSRVDPLSSTRVGGAQAYILFYEKTERKSSL